MVDERIDHRRHSVAREILPWLLNRSYAGRYGAPVNKINIGEVHIERATDGLTTFEGSHHGNERSRRDELSYTLVPVWQVVPIRSLASNAFREGPYPRIRHRGHDET